MNKIGLICVTHDPVGKNGNLVKKLGSSLNEVYQDMYITVSEETNKELIDKLGESGFKIKVIPKKGAAHARREVLRQTVPDP
jgi:hypothetical protein